MTAREDEVGGKRDFRTDIQGLRAIAVGAVLLYHAGVPFVPGGYVGVDVFFVISGFLITSHLLRSIEVHGRVRFAEFYARRARRILPASLFVVALSALAAAIWWPPVLAQSVWQAAVATILYVPNYYFAAQGTDYLSEGVPSLFQHYWSLGIEEQFYLLWPVILTIALRLVRSRRALLWVVSALVVISFIGCALITFRSQSWAFFSLPTRAWELGAGGLVAFALARGARVMPPAIAGVAGWVGLGGIVASCAFFSANTAFPGWWAALPVVSTAVVIVAGAMNDSGGPQRMLSVRGMVWVGAISYSLYLIHWPALKIPQAIAGFQRPLPLWVTLAIVALCVPAAWLMYHFIENPARMARWLRRPRVLLPTVAISMAAVMALAAVSYVVSISRPLATSLATREFTPQLAPSGTGFVPSNIVPSLVDVAGDQPTVYSDGCHVELDQSGIRSCVYGDPSAPRVVLFGDSHAAQWFPALEEMALGAGYSLELQTKSACPSADVVILRNGVPYTQCSAWRNAVLDRLEDAPPTLVIVANYSEVDFVDTHGDATWREGLRRTLQAIPSRIVLIGDTPHMVATPALCLSAHLSDTTTCDVPRDTALGSPQRAAEKEVARAEGVRYVDIVEYLCNPEMCPAIIDNVVIYRDEHHLTASASAALAPVLARRMQAVLGDPMLAADAH